jgi:archaemetzincin
MDILKRRRLRIGGLLLVAVLGWGWWFTRDYFVPPWLSVGEKAQARLLLPVIEKLKPFQSPMPAYGPMDWLGQNHESRQRFLGYLHTAPVRVDSRRHTLYVTTLGPFTAGQQKVADLTAEFLSIYFNVRVKVLPPIPLENVPPSQRRTPAGRNNEQANSIYVLDQLLKPRLPQDALSLIALTSLDLWPGPGWNFVFGQASLKDRVGVWSLDRLGDPAGGTEAYRLFLLRTLKVATHETGHMLTLPHCVNYYCNMCGSNSLQESDRQPIQLCAECVAKVCWSTQADPVARYQSLAEFCTRNGLEPEAERYRQLLTALR